MTERCILTIAVLPRAGQVWPVEAQLTATDALPVTVRGSLKLDQVELATETSPRAYGERLGRALFHGVIDSTFVRALGSGGGVLHVALAVDASELQALQWELLCAPFDGRFDHLATDQRVAFSQRIQSGVTRHFAPLPRDELRALLLVADPINSAEYGLSPVDSCAAASAIRTGLGDMPVDVLGALPGALGPATLDCLCATLTQRRYAVLHIFAHGRHHRDLGESAIFFVGEDGRARPTPQSPLANRLHDLGNGLPPLMFIAACESAIEPVGTHADSLARVLSTRLGVAAVIAMTRRISVTTAHALTTAFYRRLLVHGHADRALVEATAGLGDRVDVLVPVLYSRLAGQPLFAPSDARRAEWPAHSGHASSARWTIALAVGASTLAFALAWVTPGSWGATIESGSEVARLALRGEPEQANDITAQPTKIAGPVPTLAIERPISPPGSVTADRARDTTKATTRSRPKRSTSSLPVHLRSLSAAAMTTPRAIVDAARAELRALIPKIAPCFRDIDPAQVRPGCRASPYRQPWYEVDYGFTVDSTGKIAAIRMRSKNTNQQTPDTCLAKKLVGTAVKFGLTHPGEWFFSFRDSRALTLNEDCYVPDR